MKKIFGTILIVIYAIIAVTVTILLLSYNDYKVSELGGYTIYPVLDKKLAPEYPKGTLLIAENTEREDVKIGDNILVYKNISNTEFEIKNRKVEKIIPEGNRIIFQVEEDEQYDSEYLIAKTSDIKSYDKLGTILGLLESRWGYLFFVVIVSLILFLQEVFELVMEIKYGDGQKEEK